MDKSIELNAHQHIMKFMLMIYFIQVVILMS